MAHISKFGLGNFRVFKEFEEFDLAPISILTGTNNSGKSSFIKGLLLLRDNVRAKLFANDPSLIDIENLDFTIGEHKTGDFERSRNHYSKKKEITFSLPFYFDEIKDKMSLQLKYILDNKNQLKNGKLILINVFSKDGTLRIEIKPAMDNRWDVWFDLVYFRNHLHQLLGKMTISDEEERILLNKQEKFLDEYDWEESALLKNEEYIKILNQLDEEFHNKRILLASNKISFFPEYPTNEIRKVVSRESYYENRPLKKVEDLLPIFYKAWFFSKEFRDLFFQIVPDDYYFAFFEKHGTSAPGIDALKTKKDFDSWFEEKYLGYLDNILFHLIDSGFNFKNKEDFLKQLKTDDLWVLSATKVNKTSFGMQRSFVKDEIEGIKNGIWWYLSSIKSDIVSENFTHRPKKIIENSLTLKFLSVYDDFLDQFPDFKSLSLFFEDTLRKYEIYQYGYENVFPKIFLDKFLYEGFIRSFNESLKAISQVEFIEAVRANTQRIYTYNSQGTHFNQLLLDFESLGIEKNVEEMTFINKWTKEFGLGEEIVIKPIGSGVGTFVSVDNVPLADCGYGITQLIPILIKIATVAHKNLNRERNDYIDGYISWKYNPGKLIIEEPETNLHPKLQSKLAELFVDAAGVFNIQFIIETHSEYLIRKLQYLTANKGHQYNIKPEDTAIYYFNDPKTLKKGEKQVRRINIREDGILDGSFGPGFFDEASNLIKEIFKISGAN